LTYIVRPTRAAAALISKMPAVARSQLGTVIKQVEANGCRAAGYRLWRGEVISGLCCRHFSDDWRIIFLFPEAGRVTVCWIGQHSPLANLYADLAEVSDVLSVEGRTDRTPCCADDADAPSVSTETADFFAALHTRDVVRDASRA
jgi:hypothetical protein